MRIISLDFFRDKYHGFYDTDKEYISFTFPVGGKIEKHDVYKKSEYDSYGQFVGVMSKFDPETWFLARPRNIKRMTEANLKKVWESLPPVGE